MQDAQADVARFRVGGEELLYSYCCELSSRMSAAPRMLSLITLFSQSMACCDLHEELADAAEHDLERHRR